MAKKFKFELGVTLQDKVTGYTGVAMSRSEYLTGCMHYCIVNTTLDKEGEPKAWQDFDQSQLKLVKDVKKKAKGKSGGPHPQAVSRSK